MKYRKENIGIHILAFFAARCGIEDMYPFVISLFLAAYIEDMSDIWLYVILVLGVASTFSIGAFAKYAITLMAIIVFMALFSEKREKQNKFFVAAVGGALTAFSHAGLLVLNGAPKYTPIMALLEGVVVFSFVFILSKAIETLKEKPNIAYIKNEHVISMLCFMSIILFGTPLYIANTFTILEMVMLYGVLYVGYRFGTSYGTCVSAICGGIMAIRTGMPEYVGVFVVIGLVSGVLGELGRILSSVAVVIAIVFMGTTFFGSLIQVDSLRSIISAIALFLLTPSNFMIKMREIKRDYSMENLQEEINNITKMRLKEFANGFRRMEQIFQPNTIKMNLVSENGQVVDSYNMLNSLESMNNSIVENRKAFMGQISQIGDIIDSFTINIDDRIKLKKNVEALIIERFMKRNIAVKKIVVINNIEGKSQVFLTAKTIKGKIMTSKEAARIIGGILNQNFRVCEYSKNIIGKDYSVITFEEDTNFRALTGARKIAKYREDVSGDNYSLRELSNGQMMMLLSDGMGSGALAAAESETVVDSLEQLLEAGFKKDLAIKMLNSIVSFRSEGNAFTTLDLCVLDMYSGMCEFIKLGAATTFIKRQDWIETIKSTSLPVGILENVETDTTTKKLFDGDMVVMVSDGALDGIIFEDKEQYMADLILRLDTNDPQELVDGIVYNLLKMNGNKMKDDVSVIAMGIHGK